MAMLTDGLLLAASLFAGLYCWVLARRVRDLKSLDRGLGASIVTLTRQIELARSTLEQSRATAGETREELGRLTTRAELSAKQLRLVLAAASELEQRLIALQTAPPAPEPTREAVVTEASQAPNMPPPPAAIAKTDEEPAPAGNGADRRSEPAPEGRPDAPSILKPRHAVVTELPKPRSLPPLDTLLPPRRKEPIRPHSEEELLEALTALAGGRG